jgi:hypothetical protein
MNLYATSPFYPTLFTLGNVNHDTSYLIKIATISNKLGDIPPPSLKIRDDIKDILVGLPQNYYPETAKFRPSFNYEINPFFNRSGQQRIQISL